VQILLHLSLEERGIGEEDSIQTFSNRQVYILEKLFTACYHYFGPDRTTFTTPAHPTTTENNKGH
jgi:hypothetical protein